MPLLLRLFWTIEYVEDDAMIALIAKCLHAGESQVLWSQSSLHTVWTNNVVPAETVRRPPQETLRGGLQIF